MDEYNVKGNVDTDLMARLYLSEDEKKYAFKQLSKKRFSDRELKIEEIENGIILPCKGPAGGVCTKDFEFVAGHSHTKPDAASSSVNDFICESYIVPKDDLEYINETVVFGGLMLDHPGHQLLECIANRLWWHIQNPESKLRFVFLRGRKDTNGNFIKEFIDLLKIPEERIIFLDKPTQFSKVIVPEQSIYVHNSFTKEYMLVINSIKKQFEPGKKEKIYLTQNCKNDIINQEYFINFFSKKGFEIIEPEKYTMAEKISILRGAKQVACLGGTNALYTVFSEPDVKLFILGRANDPVAEQFIPYEAANIKDMYIIDVSLSPLHKNRVWGVNLLGATNYWKNFVNDYYNEEINEKKEDVLKQYSYEYLKRCAEYYADPYIFLQFKNFDHFHIVNLLNNIFLDKTLDKNKYNMNYPRENEIKNQLTWSNNVLNFCRELCFDNFEEKRLERYIKSLSGKNMAILKHKDRVAAVLKKVAEYYNVNIDFASTKALLQQLTPEEFAECRKADVIITCCVHGTKTHERDGVKCIDIWDILHDRSLTDNLPPVQVTDAALVAFTIEFRDLQTQIAQLTP